MASYTFKVKYTRVPLLTTEADSLYEALVRLISINIISKDGVKVGWGNWKEYIYVVKSDER